MALQLFRRSVGQEKNCPPFLVRNQGLMFLCNNCGASIRSEYLDNGSRDKKSKKNRELVCEYCSARGTLGKEFVDPFKN